MKPCPFCGETSDLETISSTEDCEGIPASIACMGCGAQGPWMYIPDLKEESIVHLKYRRNERKGEK